MHIKTAIDMIIQLWLNTFVKLVKEFRLSVSVQLVKSDYNQVDKLNKFPQY